MATIASLAARIICFKAKFEQQSHALIVAPPPPKKLYLCAYYTMPFEQSI